jgi:hypothetical protein
MVKDVRASVATQPSPPDPRPFIGAAHQLHALKRRREGRALFLVRPPFPTTGPVCCYGLACDGASLCNANLARKHLAPPITPRGDQYGRMRWYNL